MNNYKCGVAVILLLYCSAGFSAEDRSQYKESSYSHSKNHPELEHEADSAHVSVEEYQRYLELISDPLVRSDYSKLSAIEVLGINAKNPEERRKYAEAFVKQYHARVIRELLFQQAYDEAYHRLYPDEKVVDYKPTPDNSIYAIEPGDKVIAFINLNSDSSVINELIEKATKTSNIKIDFYFTTSDESAVQKWAKSHKIPHQLVKEGLVSLNLDHGELEKNSLSLKDLPIVGIVKNGNIRWLDTSL